MAARGNVAKDAVLAKIQQAFGPDWIGCYDKKAYVWGAENGEKIQVAISLTCPKTPVEVVPTLVNGGLDFENMGSAIVAPEVFTPAEITDEERETVADLMKRLGL